MPNSMPNAKLLRKILLRFRHQSRAVRADISAVTHTPDGHLWLGSDELTSIERLSPMGKTEYAEHKQYALGDYLDLQVTNAEVDIEGIDFSAGYLWIVGSHSSKRKKVKGKDPQQDIQRLLEIKKEANRYLLGRIPIVEGEPVRHDRCSGKFAAQLGVGPETGIRTGSGTCREDIGDESELIQVLRKDEHIGPFLEMNLPSKDNGFDIEALAVRDNQLFLGLRGPVLRGMAIILEVEVSDTTGVLRLKKLENNRLYRKHFVDLNGLGIRDMCFQEEDLIVLAGPTMQLSCPMQLFRFRKVRSHQQDTLWTGKRDVLTKIFDLPWTVGVDNAEGITLLRDNCDRNHSKLNQSNLNASSLLVVYDSPGEARLKRDGTALLADVFQIPVAL